jgi:hypothetical protein
MTIPFVDFQVGEYVTHRSTGLQAIVIDIMRDDNGQPIDVKVEFAGGSRPWFPPSHLGPLNEEKSA